MSGRTSLLGRIECLAEGLWFIHGRMPDHASKAPDFCNIVIYRCGRELYMVDSGGRAAMRESIRRVLRKVGAVDSFTLMMIIRARTRRRACRT